MTDDTLVWPPPDEELDALVALPLHPSDPEPGLPGAATSPAPFATPPPFAAPAAPLPLASPPDLLHGLGDFSEHRIAGDIVLHRPPPAVSRARAWALLLAGLALSSYLAYALTTLLW